MLQQKPSCGMTDVWAEGKWLPERKWARCGGLPGSQNSRRLLPQHHGQSKADSTLPGSNLLSGFIGCVPTSGSQGDRDS